MKTLISLLIAALALLPGSEGAIAQPYPDRPITIIVPFPAGNSSDVVMRLLAQELQPTLGQPVIVENKAGAGGTIGAAAAARHPNDGYTLLMGSPGPMAINPSMRKGLTYDPTKSFDPVAPVALLPMVIVVSAESGIKDLPALLKRARENPGSVNYASSGIGSSQHLVMASLAAQAGVNMTNVPFQGTAAGMTAIVGGQVQVMVDVLSAVLPLVKAGKLVPIAAAGTQRLPTLPNVPTVSEQGVKDFAAETWIMLYAPAGIQADKAKRLNTEIARTLQNERLTRIFDELSLLPMPIPYDGMKEFMTNEVAAWRKRVEISGATAE